MYSKELEELIDIVLADGVITDKELNVLYKRAGEEGVNIDELEVYLEGRLHKMNKQQPVGVQSVPPQYPKKESIKYGKLNRCPSCNAIVIAGHASCAECGYDFRGLEANSSAKELAQQLAKKREASHHDIIINFPVPSTKDDLIEFIFSMRAKAFGFNIMADAYRKKYYECADKAEFYFNNDPRFAPIISQAKRDKSLPWKNISYRVKFGVLQGIRYIGMGILAIIIMVILLLKDKYK